MSHSFSSLTELGDGYGFRKIRTTMGIEAFGVNAIVMPGGFEGFWHFHETQDELYFVHRGIARVETGDPAAPEVRELAEGGLFHASSTTPRRVGNAGSEDLVLLVVGGHGGYVPRDGQMMDEADIERRRHALGGSQP